MFANGAARKHSGRSENPWEEGVVPIIAWGNHWSREDLEALQGYLDAHDLLPERPEELSEEAIAGRAAALWDEGRAREEKEQALILLAHHRSTLSFELLRRYLGAPDPGLARFARFAYQESLDWLRLLCLVDLDEPCPCGSGDPFKRCCGGRPS